LEIFKWPIPSAHFFVGKMRPAPAALDVPNVKVKMETQHSILLLSPHELLWEKLQKKVYKLMGRGEKLFGGDVMHKMSA
jgi:hypothetical protein